MIFVAHSQGNLIVDRALRIVAQNHVLNDPPSRCTALLSLATPLHPDDFILGPDYRRHLTVKHDILRHYGMNYPDKVFELNTPLSRQADSVLQAASQTKGPREMSGLYGHWGTLIHNAAENYFRPDTSIMIVKNRLTQLRQKCTGEFQ